MMPCRVVPSILSSFVPIIGKIEVEFDKYVDLSRIESRKNGLLLFFEGYFLAQKSFYKKFYNFYSFTLII